jgi:hypothetical protein
MRLRLLSFLPASVLLLSPMANAQEPTPSQDNEAIESCRLAGLAALKADSPTLKDLILDIDGMVVATAKTSIEGIPVRKVVLGEAYLERKDTGAPQRFLCLIGEKDKVLLTFFTVR